jgi:molybdopterin adenylyltransferase
MPLRASILTASDLGSRGERADTSGDAAAELLRAAGIEVAARAIVPDERDQIASRLRAWCDARDAVDIIITTGGTGIAPRDVTPDATADVAERLVPGIAEAMRAEGVRNTPFAMLGRGIAAVRGRTLIVNLPGSEKGVRESLAVVIPVLSHAAAQLHGDTAH